MTPDTYGPTCSEPFAYYDPDSSSLRMCEDTFDWDSMPSCVTLPPSGSMRSGWLYERPLLALPTAESDCSSLPTPQASDWKGPNLSGSASGLANGLATVTVSLLPTPDASPEKYRLGGDSQQSHSLPAMARRGELGP